MEFVKGVRELNREIPRSVVTIGNFDGVHRGHREIMGLAVQKALSTGASSVVYTFRPHPRVALRPEQPFRLLTTYDERAQLIEELGPSLLVEEPFSREFSTTTAEEFFSRVLVGILRAEAIVVGHDFGFGKSRQGHLDSLKGFCERTSVELTIVPPFKVSGEVVSSSRIRSLLDSGLIREANALLGYCFGYKGIVVKGDGRGRTLGFPTCNLQTIPKLELPFGVYATWTRLSDGVRIPSVTNIGVRPTFQKSESANGLTSAREGAQVESHILDFSRDIYGDPLGLEFVEKLRDERKFDGVVALKAQIQSDIQLARRILVSPST